MRGIEETDGGAGAGEGDQGGVAYTGSCGLVRGGDGCKCLTEWSSGPV